MTQHHIVSFAGDTDTDEEKPKIGRKLTGNLS